ncbi:hypothetical protein SPOG_00307 [Schizosaccharomyces cryophilus OY26]|uniref:Uncharacterized protein n=1 Tax=Schizosaccharomyces cryophilus (strain OY26 / ATCC MYA-4695 / CBS 11777 / NBRC 106824 / NRRL Y48691) TaxID=653667 RepID=S9W1L2_SCHCR|nr:uncharacterized protein SPOG_00307 [Schizosaccharomyces cryophilus OY26]EPY51885.1 hypothetical protein SPOG_00307 [Schizosaccharomyces cryophilus OY26]
MAEEKLKLDSSDFTAHNQSNVYNVDLEKGLCLDTQQDINKSSYSTSLKCNNRKKTIMNESQNFIALIKKYHEEILKQLSLRFPDNVVIKDRNCHLTVILFYSLMCTLAISNSFELLSWLEYSWTLLGPLLMIWATLYALFYFLSSLAVVVVRTAAQVIMYILIIGGAFIGALIIGVGALIGAAGVFLIGLLCWGFYNILVFCLGMEFECSAENTGSSTLPRYLAKG